MAALTQDKDVLTKGPAGIVRRFVITTSQKLYRGSVAMFDEDSGRAQEAAAATGMRIAGLVESFSGATGTGTGVAGATEFAHVRSGCLALVNVLTAIRTTTSLGLNVFASDDQTVGGTAVGTSAARVIVGELVEFEASDKSTGWVALGVYAATNIAV